jgi:dethiobiotin synthase
MIFITGTDTDIGKTFISLILCRLLKFDYFKPIQTGVKTDISDSNYIHKFGVKTHQESYVFNEPVSPNVAAEIENKEILIQNIKLPKKEKLIVEGAGGLFVPINKNQKIIDIIVHFNIPVIVISEDRLGTINHTLLTLEALKNKGLNTLGFIMNRCKKNNIQNNIKTIEQHSGIDCIGKIDDGLDMNLIDFNTPPKSMSDLRDNILAILK